MPPPQHAQGFQDKDARASAGNAGGGARPSDVSVPAGGNGTNAAAAVYAKPLTEKEMLAADEAKDKLDRMVKTKLVFLDTAGMAHARFEPCIGRYLKHLKNLVEALVGKRKRFFSYLKKTHEEGGFWLNCVQLTRQGDLAVYAAELSSQRILRLFYLGVGLAKLLQSKGGLELIRGILQLLEEWEYHFALAGVAHHSVKAMLAKNIDNVDHSARGRDASEEGGGKHQEQVVARLKKFNNEVVYENLLTPEVPFALDYLEVVFSLCEVMCRIYAKFVEEECYKNAFVYDGLVKVDNKIKHHIINVFAKEFTDMSTNIAKDELKTLR